jgi:hypothetical protein
MGSQELFETTVQKPSVLNEIACTISKLGKAPERV